MSLISGEQSERAAVETHSRPDSFPCRAGFLEAVLGASSYRASPCRRAK